MEQAYQSNLATAEKVIKALLAAGLPKEQIESNALELGEDSSNTASQSSGPPTHQQFKAHQSWRIRVTAADAQRLIDVAVAAGANGVEEVSWDVADEDSLEGKARAAAMEKGAQNRGGLGQSWSGKIGRVALYQQCQYEVFSERKSVPSNSRGKRRRGWFRVPCTHIFFEVIS